MVAIGRQLAGFATGKDREAKKLSYGQLVRKTQVFLIPELLSAPLL